MHTCVFRFLSLHGGSHHRYSSRVWVLLLQSLTPISWAFGSWSAGRPAGDQHVRDNHDWRWSLGSQYYTVVYAAPWQECPSQLDCCRCGRWCNWRRFHRGRYFCEGMWRRLLRKLHFNATEKKTGQEFLTQSSAVRWASLPALNSLPLWWWTGLPSWVDWTNPLKE